MAPFIQASASLLAHPLRASLGAGAIAVAVATTIVVVVALDGVARYARASAARAFGSDTFVLARVASPGQISRRELELKLQRNPPIDRGDVRFLDRYAGGVAEYAVSAQRAAEVTAGARTYDNASVVGASASLADLRDLAVAEGRFFGPEEESRGSQVVVVGADIADALFPSVDPIGRRLRLAGRGFVVIGVQARLGNLGGTSLDRNVWMPLKAYERAFGPAGTLQVLGRAALPEPAVADTTAAEDRARVTMRARRQLGPGTADTFDILTPDAARSFVFRLSERIGLAAGPISLMALLAAVVVVTNTILVSVTERTREIGVRRAVGASRRQILREVLAESTILAILGGAAGIVAAAVLVRLAAGASGYDLRLDPDTVAISLIAAGLSGLAAGWYPARRATRIDVIAAIRSE